MHIEGTIPVEHHPRMPVRTLAVDVLEGPDAGQHGEANEESLAIGTAPGNVMVLTDPTVSGYHLELSRCDRGVCVADLRSTNGTLVGDVRIERGVVPPGSVLKIGHTSLRVTDGAGTVVEVLETDHLGDLLGRTESMRRLMAQVSRVAKSPVPVLLIGESGTGKELIAKALREEGTRPDKPLVTVDCGVLTPNLAASELFGHERGAFTGAERQHIGAFERADGGTLFLDEVGELPASLQVQLLGVLERRKFVRVGGKQEISVDVRLIAATNRDLRAEVNAGAFRMDLYYRLAIVVLRIPPLRDRVDDIALLVEHFARECGHAGPMEEVVPPDLMGALRAYRWPGNVRELRNWVEATLAMGEAPDLLKSELSPAKDECVADRVLNLPYQQARNTLLHDFEERYLKHLMDAAGGNVSHGARQARMDRSYLIKLLQRHGMR